MSEKDKESDKQTPQTNSTDDMFETTMMPAPGQQQEPKLGGSDPHATEFIDASTLTPPSPVDIHATTLQPPPAQPSATPPAAQKTADDAAPTMIEMRTPLSAREPASPPPSAGMRAAPTAPSQPTIRQIARTSIYTALPDKIGILPTRLLLWVEYLVLLLLAAFGLALATRMIVLMVIFGEFRAVPIVLGILGAIAPVGIFFGLSLAPPLIGLEEKLDQFENKASNNRLVGSIETPRAAVGPWLIAMFTLIVVAGLADAWLIYDAVAELDDDISQIGAAILGVVGGALVAALGGISEKHAPFTSTSARAFDFRHLIRPMAVGIGLPAFAAGLALIGENAWDIPLYFLLALIGMVGIAGSSLRTMPLRLHQWVGRLQVGSLAGVAAVAAMSLVSVLLDAHKIGDAFDFKIRYAYSPKNLLFTPLSAVIDRNTILSSLYGIPLVVAGLLGAWLVLQAFSYDLLKDRQQRQNVATLVAGSLGVLLLLLVIIWLVVWLLPFGETFESWLLWGIPFTLLFLEVIAIHHRPGLIDGILSQLQKLVALIPSQADFLKRPLAQFTALRSAQIQPVVTWQLGMVLAIVGSVVMLPLMASFWFWPLLLVAGLYLKHLMTPGKPAPSVQSPPLPPTPPSSAA